jgi:hypothetical protein
MHRWNMIGTADDSDDFGYQDQVLDIDRSLGDLVPIRAHFEAATFSVSVSMPSPVQTPGPVSEPAPAAVTASIRKPAAKAAKPVAAPAKTAKAPPKKSAAKKPTKSSTKKSAARR